MTDLELYTKAKEAYYNGAPIMTDYEFDELEEKLGLANKSYVGAKHNPSYTIQHPYIMGSLSKVQIKEKNGTVDWLGYFEEVKKYVCKNSADRLIITPKYDGCSFEMHFNKKDCSVVISSRGDGEYGKDLTSHLSRKIDKSFYTIPSQEYTLRGEVLIDKNTFENKYSEFVNPRSFVSGILNRDYTEDTDFQEMLDDLSIVIYDIREKINGQWVDTDFNNYSTITNTPEYFYAIDLKDVQFEKLYNDFNTYREKCPYALDGIVFKPSHKYRMNNTTETRPKDCVAVKFMPMLQETEVIDIEWSVAKNGELRPVIITNPVIMDGKSITRASAHNYGYLIDNRICIGTKVILSLAGDIIPFIYKVTDTSVYDKAFDKWVSSKIEFDSVGLYNLPNVEYLRDGCHLIKVMTEEEIRKQKFIESANTLGIPSIGPAAAQTIYNYLVENSAGDEFLGVEQKEVPCNILLIDSTDIQNALGGKLGSNAAKAFNDYIKNITLSDIIMSMTIDGCGRKVAEQIEKQWLTEDGDFSHLAYKAYEWIEDDGPENQLVNEILFKLGLSFESFKQKYESTYKENLNTIPIIMTGEPNDYDTKGAFLKAHPEYRNTGSWKECKILFTNDLDSQTAKMKKAKQLGIEIKLY